jgi:drug/metabolite transporter (DMT)-like permease
VSARVPEQRPGAGGVLLILGIGLFWGLNWPAVKIALSEIPPWTLRTLGLGCGAAILLLAARLNGHSLAVPRGERGPLILAGCLTVAGFNLLSAFGQLHMPASRAAIIAFTMPAWATLLSAVFLRDPLTLNRLASLALGMAGLALLVAPDLRALEAAPLGPMFMLGAALSWAAGTVLIKRVPWTIPTLVLAAWQVAAAVVPIAIGALVLERPFDLAWPSPPVAVALTFHILLPMAFCHYAWMGIVARYPAPVAAIATLLIPVVGVVSSVLILGETAGPREVGALALVLASVALVLVWPALAGWWTRRR